MSIDVSTARAVQDARDSRIRAAEANRASTHLAEVVDIDKQGTVWVHLFGGADRTPVGKVLAHVEKGDVVMATIEDGSVTLMGSPSSPAASVKQVDKVAGEASEARDYALGAVENAAIAEAAAKSAQNSAVVANDAANSALTELSIIEDVAGTLDWISKNGDYVAATDTSVDPEKVYFEYDSTAHDYTPIVMPDPNANPSTEGWYVLDVTSSQSEFIMAHLAVTTRGLWVLPSGIAQTDQTVDNSVDKASSSDTAAQKQANANARKGANYKVLLSNDGMYIYDGTGAEVVKYGSSIVFNSNRGFSIGDTTGTSYIAFVPGQGVVIGGGVQIGSSQTLSELMADAQNAVQIAESTLIYDHTYVYNQAHTQATFTAHLYQGGVDVAGTAGFPAEQFAWYRKTEDAGDSLTLLGTGLTCTVSLSSMGYGGHIVGTYTSSQDALLLDEDDDQLTTSDGTPLTARTSNGETVRVSDLTVATAVYPSEQIMVVGAGEEHLVSIQTLQDYFEAAMAKQVLFGTTAEWNADLSLVGEEETLYVYTDRVLDSSGDYYAGIKVGDGSAYLVDLPFVDGYFVDHIADTSIHVTSQEKAFWNNKVRCYMAGVDQLLFTTS